MSLYVRILACALLLSCLVLSQAAHPAQQKSRSFQFTYHTTLQGLEPGQVYRLWMPIPQSNEYQSATPVEGNQPASGKITSESRFGNRMLYVEGKADAQGQATVSTEYRVTRKEVTSSGPVPTATEVDIFVKAV